jgi:putative ABC transport system permease protein
MAKSKTKFSEHRLIWANLKRNKIRSLLTSFAICLSVFCLFLATSLNLGFKQAMRETAEKRSPLNQITIQEKQQGNVVGSLLGTLQDQKITDETIRQISQIRGITAIYGEIPYIKPTSLEVSFLGERLQSDTMVYGLDYNFLKDDLAADTNWQKEIQIKPYPAIISKRLLDLYNVSVARPQGIPQLTPDLIIGQEIDLFLGHSSFFGPFADKSKADKITVRVEGLSDKTNLIGVTLPISVVKKLNLQADPTYQNKYISLYAETASSDQVNRIAAEIEEKFNLETKKISEVYEQLDANFSYLNLGFTIITLIILCLAGISMINSFFANVNERINEIGLLKAIGATKKNITTIFLKEAFGMGLISGIIAIFLATISTIPLNQIIKQSLPQLSSLPENFFSINWQIISIFLIATTAIGVAAALLPALKAANLNTIESLNN